MAGLRATTERLAAYRRHWETLSASHSYAAGSPSSLVEHPEFGANPGQLRMLSHVPDDLPARAPLVVVLHGCKQDAPGYGGNAGWTALADKLGFAVLLPEQRASNNPNACFNWFLPDDVTRDRGEAASIRQMIERIVVDHDLDRARIFVTGLSAGGAMASVMLATYPEVFAGGAIVAGLPFGVARNVQEALDAMFQGGGRSASELADKVRAASSHSGPWPKISIWHGSADTTVKPSNAGESEKQWSAIHGLQPDTAESHKVDGRVRRVWRNAAGQAVMESYTIAGMAHGTPIAAKHAEAGGGTPAPFILEAGISSTIRIAEFWGLMDAQAAVRPEASRKKTDGAEQEVIYLPGPQATASAKTPRPRPQTRQGAANEPVMKKGGFKIDPQAVIDKALRAAGLLKG